ncbi:hypothetical protein [Acanthamoeba polyphaga mimivirus]|nr:hypothetical protein [Acanthamoeba castellanii mamavirus]EJN40727.1 hypothetical protein lvs_L223 [Acanthamoeba polyphaga lentillevirus]UMZ08212.1 hypothetical protein [Acanthamoeba polyphaga mimivirus]
MDFNKLYVLAQNNLFTDITIILKDESNEIMLNLHKNIIYSSCIFFEKLLTSFKEKESSKIILNVPNAIIVNDIIWDFYGQKIKSHNYPEWKYFIESYKCFDYFGMNTDKEKLYKLIVEPDGFDELMDFIDLIGYDENAIGLIFNNLPDDYDLSKFSHELLTEMLSMYKKNLVQITTRNEIIVLNDFFDGTIRSTEHCINSPEVILFCASNASKIVTFDGHNIRILESNNSILLSDDSTVSDAGTILHISHSQNRNVLVILYEYRIDVWDVLINKLIASFRVPFIKKLSCSYDGSQLVYVDNNNIMTVKNILSEEIISEINLQNLPEISNNFCILELILETNSQDLSEIPNDLYTLELKSEPDQSIDFIKSNFQHNLDNSDDLDNLDGLDDLNNSDDLDNLDGLDDLNNSDDLNDSDDLDDYNNLNYNLNDLEIICSSNNEIFENVSTHYCIDVNDCNHIDNIDSLNLQSPAQDLSDSLSPIDYIDSSNLQSPIQNISDSQSSTDWIVSPNTQSPVYYLSKLDGSINGEKLSDALSIENDSISDNSDNLNNSDNSDDLDNSDNSDNPDNSDYLLEYLVNTDKTNYMFNLTYSIHTDKTNKRFNLENPYEQFSFINNFCLLYINNKVIYFIDIIDKKIIHKETCRRNIVNMRCSPTGDSITIIDSEYIVYIYKLVTDSNGFLCYPIVDYCILVCDSFLPTKIEYSSNGRYLVFDNDGSSINLYDIEQLEMTNEFELFCNSKIIVDITFSENYCDELINRLNNALKKIEQKYPN